MAVTLKDLSKYCGLSISAVSKSLNNYSDVSEETRQRVLKAARDIGYHPNAIARGLKTNRTFNLGVILDNDLQDSLLHTYFIIILNGFKREAERRGYDITLINHNIGGQTLSYLDHCRYRNVDGVCILCVDFYNPEIQNLVQSEIPLITVDHLFSGKDCILSDNKKGMLDLMRYIISMGHRRVAFIRGTDSAVTDARLTAYWDAVHEYGLEVPPYYAVASHYHSTRRVMEDTKKLLSSPVPPTCILMPDDYSALGGMDAIRQMGLRVPEDISIAGYDGISLIQKIHPLLTTVRQDGEEIGRQAAIRLLSRVSDPLETQSRPIIVPGDLLSGETVRRLN